MRNQGRRRLLAAGLTLALAYTSGVGALGGCAGAPWPSNGNLPPRVVDRLTDCGKKGPAPLESVNYDLAFTVHVTEDDQEARVDDVMLTGSTLHLHEVEACMADALYGMRTPLEALALRRRKLAPDPNGPTEARAMFGQAEVALLLDAGVVLVVGFAVYTVVVHVILDKHHKKPRPHPAQAETAEPPAPAPALATATAEPTATAAPTATTVPTAIPAGDEDDPCMPLMVECLENKKQPAWNRRTYGPEKDCLGCYRQCRFHSKNHVWPENKCPRK